MLCRVEMPMNEQIFGRFYRYKLLHTPGSNSKFGLIGMPVLVLILGVFMVLNGMDILIIGLLGLAVVAYIVYSLSIKPNQAFRKKSGAALQKEVTIFTDNGFNRSVRSEEGGMPETTSGQYSALYQAVETKQDFYLFTSPAQAYLIDKAYFTKGTPQELHATLEAKLGSKFTYPGKPKEKKKGPPRA